MSLTTTLDKPASQEEAVSVRGEAAGAERVLTPAAIAFLEKLVRTDRGRAGRARNV